MVQVIDKLSAGIVLVILASFLTQCTSTGGITRTPTTTPPTTKPDATPKGQQTGSGSQTIMSESVQLLNDAGSYQFSISAILRTTFEGKPKEWTYSGAGAVAKPAKIQWSLEGQADVFFKVVSVDGKIYCADARGENKDCSLAFGGPGPGASPYTIISYLQNFERSSEATTKNIQGKEYSFITFSPSLPKIASLDPAHAKALAAVESVAGEVLIDKVSKLPYQEKVLIKYKPQTPGAEMVESTITFQQYNQPVDIRSPR